MQGVKAYFDFYSGYSVDIQSEVEEPELYLLARCPSNDQQVLYSETRIEDLMDLSNNIANEDGIFIKDVMRIFKGKTWLMYILNETSVKFFKRVSSV